MEAMANGGVRHYCTYFDHRYLPRGLALLASLRRHSAGSILWVLCLSDECCDALAKLDYPDVRTIPLAELEAFDPQLAATRPTRSLVEYYFTCSPCIPRYVLTVAPDADIVTYLDSDLYFLSSAEAVFDELGSASVGITPHRFTPESARTHAKYGEFNVGLLSFRRDANGLACLDWWREQCLAWCEDRIDGDRFADQKYLEQFAKLFSGVLAFSHSGINLAPWNLGHYQISGSPEMPLVNGDPIVVFHFQGVRRVGEKRFDSNLSGYGGRLTAEVDRLVYHPYLTELSDIERHLVATGLIRRLEPSTRRQARGMLAAWRALKRAILLARTWMEGNIVDLGHEG